MKSFRTYINESKNLHMEHLEDSVFNEGSSGVVDAIRFLESVTDMLSGSSKGKVNITVKWDGAPAVFAGTHPETKKFFVGTKSIFNKNPKINYTNADIDQNHGDSPGLASKLKTSLQYLKGLNIKGILQGDLLFTEGDISTTSLDGEDHITFQPNTITYAVPTDSKLAKQMLSAKIGVVWHTKYTGRDMENMKASFGPSVRSLTKTKNVWFTDADFRDVHGSANFTTSEVKEMTKTINMVKSSFRKAGRFVDELYKNTKLIAELKIYGNSKVKEGSTDLSAAEFTNYVNNKMQTSIDKLKSAAGKSRKQSEKDKLLGYLTKNSRKLDLVFNLHAALTTAKLKVLRQLQKVKSIGTFIKTNNGYEVTAPEGFVAIDQTNKALKLVDRLEFSRQNFTASKNWIKGE
tara:strand:- start:95 stop:1306 length:1212 start_codon:yes stop_codon:yes gene_type:complete